MSKTTLGIEPRGGVLAMLVASVVVMAAAPVLAQAPPSVTAPPASGGNTLRDPKACAPSQQVNPQQPPGATTGQSPPGGSQNLSDKLAQTDGVLCPPPGVDPEIRAPTPDVGTTPVIPPPGSPGGDPTLRPK